MTGPKSQMDNFWEVMQLEEGWLLQTAGFRCQDANMMARTIRNFSAVTSPLQKMVHFHAANIRLNAQTASRTFFVVVR